MIKMLSVRFLRHTIILIVCMTHNCTVEEDIDVAGRNDKHATERCCELSTFTESYEKRRKTEGCGSKNCIVNRGI